MTIKLEQELIVTSDKTIDAKGANMEICNVLVLLFTLRRTSLSMAFKSITLFPPRVARSNMVKTTIGYGVPATEMGSLLLE
ncbi:hypothetical protein Gogos_021067 [Gossypium gossypioides]|uniref:Uncharacterized protein n=1 Tax=Gossypium gossypioides TaxID=34282 RepID=A0A7J9CZV0_GOSGO|nr:hypothetical protein [Gossypium gossypioides]